MCIRLNIDLNELSVCEKGINFLGEAAKSSAVTSGKSWCYMLIFVDKNAATRL